MLLAHFGFDLHVTFALHSTVQTVFSTSTPLLFDFVHLLFAVKMI